ncbi:hypothetical protein GGU11DRAFT_761587, partial [Lentinula aff. detonsa]
MSVHNLPTQDGFEGDDEDEDKNEDENEDMEDVPESRGEGTSSNRNEFFLYWSSQGYNVMDPQFLAWAQQQGHGWPRPSVEEVSDQEYLPLRNKNDLGVNEPLLRRMLDSEGEQAPQPPKQNPSMPSSSLPPQTNEAPPFHDSSGVNGSFPHRNADPPQFPNSSGVDGNAMNCQRLQSEIASLINLAIPDESIKSHFWALLNCWQHDMAQLKNILKQCYQYIGIMPSVPVPLEADYETYAPKPKLYQAPQHRAEGKVELADMVRQEVGILMKIIPGDDDIQTEADATNRPPLKKPLATVSTATLLLWKKNLAEGPSVHNFVLQLDGGIRTAWNKAAAIVFCRYFVAKHACYKVDDVKTAFMTRITQLRRDFERQGKEKTAE